jgi:transposase-like protein
MNISAPTTPYKHHRFPAEIISPSVWLYHRFCLSYRDVPMRQRKRRMPGFKLLGQVQRFLSAYGPIASHFRPRHHLLPASEYRQEMTHRFQIWREMMGTVMAA